MIEGLVVKSTGSWYTVEANDKIYDCKLKGNFRIKGLKFTNPIAVGDKVKFVVLSDGKTGLIGEILKRKNYIIRKATKLSKKAHIIASNIDQAVLIVTLAMPRTSTGFIDRFTLTAEAYHIPVKIVFNKIDLYDASMKADLDKLLNIYQNIGYSCFTTSVKTKKNIENFKELLQDKVSLLSGHSGVGKSALINTVEPALNLKTAALSTFHNKGRHTTTFAQIHKLSFKGYVIDTPGIKEFGLTDFKKEEVSHYFPEMRALIGKCKFNNCSHQNEPGCAITDAVNKGAIAKSRYQNYVNIYTNNEDFAEDYE